MKLAAGCPLVEVQWTLLQYSLWSFFEHHHYTHRFLQGVAIGNDCSHLKTFLLHITQITVYLIPPARC